MKLKNFFRITQLLSRVVKTGYHFVSTRSFARKTAIALFGVAVFLLVFVPVSYALDTGITYGTYTGLGNQDIRITIMKIVRVALGFVGVIALVIILYAGFIWMTSAGNPEKIDQAKKTLRNAAIGLVIIFLAFSIVSFIINLLNDALGGGGTGPDGPGYCIGCDHLGNGIVESVYPVPYAREVARNTNIIVKFKVTMDPSTIIEDTNNDDIYGNCIDIGTEGDPDIVCDNINDNNIVIYPDKKNPSNTKLASNQVYAATTDNKTFIFNPLVPLGDGVNNVWYRTLLTGEVKKDSGQGAFIDRTINSFDWPYEIGTFLDLDTPELDSVFPEPDNSSDSYNITEATQATALLTILDNPKVAQQSGVSDKAVVPSSPNFTISGNYNCQVNALVCVNNVDGGYKLNSRSAEATACADDPETPTDESGTPTTIPGMFRDADLDYNDDASSLNIGCGLTLAFDGNPVAGNGWSFKATAGQTADTLQVGTQLYTFVSEATAVNHIAVVANDITATAQNIFAKIGALNNSVIANFDGDDTINLTASVAGQPGNSITLQPSGPWATARPFSGGKSIELNPTVDSGGVADKPRNAIITIDFNEAINPALVSTSTIQIRYYDLAGAPQEVPGTFNVSNQFKTVEFVPEAQCEIDGRVVQNACGDPIFCLPVNDPSSYTATKYEVKILAGELTSCTSTSCLDGTFNSCEVIGSGTATACRSILLGAYYPEASLDPGGITDAANNSFSGNKNTYTIGIELFGRADGSTAQNNYSFYNLNNNYKENPSPTDGDDLVWTFYINKDIKVAPPVIESIEPFIYDVNANVADSVKARYGDLLQSSTLKSGKNYRDGLCGCGQDSDCTGENEVCDTERSKCVQKDEQASQQYCLEDAECSDAFSCHNKRYISLLDNASTPVGWWIQKEGVDVPRNGYKDGYYDKNNALIAHTTFLEATLYGAEYGSGIKDIYQNCYLPSEGPGYPAGTDCGTEAAFPFCCNGQKSASECGIY